MINNSWCSDFVETVPAVLIQAIVPLRRVFKYLIMVLQTWVSRIFYIRETHIYSLFHLFLFTPFSA